MAMKHALNVDKSNNFECYSPHWSKLVQATIFAHFRHGVHEPEVVIYQPLRHLQDRVMSYFIASEHDKSDGMYVNSVRELVAHNSSFM